MLFCLLFCCFMLTAEDLDIEFGWTEDQISLSTGMWYDSSSGVGMMFNVEALLVNVNEDHRIFTYIDYGFEFADEFGTSSMLFTAGLGYRYTLPFGLNFSVAAGIGWYSSEGFGFKMNVDDDGVVQVQNDAWNSVFTASAEIGYDFSNQFDLPVEVFARVQGYDHFVGLGDDPMNFNVSIGILSRFPCFLRRPGQAYLKL